MKNIYIILFVSVLFSSLFAQLDLKRDDFVGTKNRNWWSWFNDGPNTPMPAVSDGYVLFSLVDPDTSYDPFCDAALWDGYPEYGGPYQNCVITLRARALNPHKFGSRGWGLWYTEPYPYLQQQAWFMRELDSTGQGYTGIDWWRAETANGRTEATHHYVDLDTLPYQVDMQEWHVYKIDRQTDYIRFMIDGDTVLTVTEDLPPEDLAFHIWVDNLVYEHEDPDIINIYKREWKGKNEIVLDYVQILTQGALDKSESAAHVKLLRQVPREIYTEPGAGLWKDYSFDAPQCGLVILATGRVEQYIRDDSIVISDDDDIRFVVNGVDYGWNSAQSFDADAAGTRSMTLMLQQDVAAGSQTVQLYGETSPMLYDVTVLGAPQGGIVFDQEYYETKSPDTDSLWKEINFNTNGGWVAVYVSGSADEDSTPTNYGYQYSNFDDNRDDDLRIELDNHDYGYKTEQSFYGNRLFGEPKSVLIQDSLTKGSHTLRLYAHGSPDLYRVVIYGENDEVNSAIDAQDRLPGQYKLEQNYPNPFNGTTQIRFFVPERAFVDLAVFDLSGRKVASIAHGWYTKGAYRLNWDARDDSGRVLSSGIYFYTLKTNTGQTFSRKLLLLK